MNESSEVKLLGNRTPATGSNQVVLDGSTNLFLLDADQVEQLLACMNA